MDHFGMGNAVHGAARTVFQAARRTGRTLSLLASVRDGDVIVFHDPREARRVKTMLAEAGLLKVECHVTPAGCPHDLYNQPPIEGRLLFDHGWVEQFYLNALERTRAEIDDMQSRFSALDPLAPTKRARVEHMTWGPV